MHSTCPHIRNAHAACCDTPDSPDPLRSPKDRRSAATPPLVGVPPRAIGASIFVFPHTKLGKTDQSSTKSDQGVASWSSTHRSLVGFGRNYIERLDVGNQAIEEPMALGGRPMRGSGPRSSVKSSRGLSKERSLRRDRSWRALLMASPWRLSRRSRCRENVEFAQLRPAGTSRSNSGNAPDLSSSRLQGGRSAAAATAAA